MDYKKLFEETKIEISIADYINLYNADIILIRQNETGECIVIEREIYSSYDSLEQAHNSLLDDYDYTLTELEECLENSWLETVLIYSEETLVSAIKNLLTDVEVAFLNY